MTPAPRTVLIVDDEPMIRDVLATILDLEEFVVRAAADGEQALADVAEHTPDVVVCDVSMPGIDGFEVCRRLKADPATAHVPVILLTARDRAQDRAAGEAAGCDAYLTKPFSPLHLIEVIGSLHGTGPDEPAASGRASWPER